MIQYHNLGVVESVCICPDCGSDLRRFEPLDYGNIAIDRRGNLLFEGHRLSLPKSQHLIVVALVKAKGRGLTRSILADVIGGEIYDQTVSKYIERVRSSFRTIVPGFDQIRAIRGFGAYKWEFRR